MTTNAYITGRQAIYLMQRGWMLSVSYGAFAAGAWLEPVALRDPHRPHLRWHSFEMLKRHAWIEEKPRTEGQAFWRTWYRLTATGRKALGVKP